MLHYGFGHFTSQWQVTFAEKIVSRKKAICHASPTIGHMHNSVIFGCNIFFISQKNETNMAESSNTFGENNF